MMHVQGYLFLFFLQPSLLSSRYQRYVDRLLALLKLPCTSQHVHDETHLSLKNAWLQLVSFLDFNNVT